MATRNTAKKYRLSDYQKIRDNFLDELIRASKDQPNSISYFRHHFPKQPIVASGLIQAFVIGGTNFDISTAEILKNGTIKEIKNERINGKIPQLANATTLLRFIKQYSNPQAQALAFNFAFPLIPTNGKFGEVDGKLQIGTKEHLFAGLLGKTLGDTIRTYIKRDIPVTVVNDTVCLGTNGLVVGSGFNLCITGVNLEAGNFNRFPTTEELEAIDTFSVNPGGHRFEKLLAGTYLPLHFNLLTKKHKIPATAKDGRDLTEFAATDKGHVGKLSRMLMTRSASLVASAVAAAYVFSNKKTLTFATEGSLFWKGHNFEKHVKKQLLKLGVPKDAIRFEKIDDSSMQGALSLLLRTK